MHRVVPKHLAHGLAAPLGLKTWARAAARLLAWVTAHMTASQPAAAPQSLRHSFCKKRDAWWYDCGGGVRGALRSWRYRRRRRRAPIATSRSVTRISLQLLHNWSCALPWGWGRGGRKGGLKLSASFNLWTGVGDCVITAGAARGGLAFRGINYDCSTTGAVVFHGGGGGGGERAG